VKSKKWLGEIYTSSFYENVDSLSLYENWLNEFIPCDKS
jgi:hypothetical protein